MVESSSEVRSLPRVSTRSSSQAPLSTHTSSSGCTSDCLTYQPKSTLTSVKVSARLASTEAVSSSEASNLGREIDVALKDLEGFDAQISRLRFSILALQNERAAFEECITDSKSLLSPIRKLPMEMMTQIFSFCCAQNRVIVGLEEENKVTIDAPATTLMQVCRSWTSTVASAKALWGTIRLDIRSDMSDRDSDKVQAAIFRLLEASGELTPLDVTIETISIQGELHSSVSSLVSQAKRWQVASLSFLHPGGDQLWQALKDNLPHLERLNMKLCWQPGHPENYDMCAHAPRLRKIALRDFEPGSSVSLPYSQMKAIRLMYVCLRDTLDILHQASPLEHLTLFDPPEESDETLTDKTVHAFPVKYFWMIWKRRPHSVIDLLTRLSFPALEGLHLDDRNCYEPAQDRFQVGIELLSHLSPSSKTLQTLILERVTMHEDVLAGLFIMLPHVKTLRLLKTSASQGVTTKLIRRLHGYGNGGAQRVLLPELADLEIDLANAGGGTFASLLDMVRSRLVRDAGRANCSFAGLKKVSLWIRDQRFDEGLRADVLDCTVGGMHVCIRDSEGFVEYS